MNLSLNILLDQLRDLPYEVYVPDSGKRAFSRAALLPRNYEVMRGDLIHICRLSDALRAAAVKPGMFYLCIRDRIKDGRETEEALQGMVVINENMDVELLLARVQDIFVQVTHWCMRMQEALIREESLQTILNLSDQVIGNTINISDSAFTMLAITENIATDDAMSTALREFGYHPESTLHMFRENHRLELYSTAQSLLINDDFKMSKYVLVSKVFRFQNTYFTHVVMVCDHHPMSEGLMELFQMLTDILAVYAERNWKDKNALSHNYDSFIYDLLEGTLTQQEDIYERARYLGLWHSGPFVLVKLSAAQGLEAILGRIGRELTELLPYAQVVLYQQSILALIHLSARSDTPAFPRAQLIQFLTRHQASAGMSNPFTGLENIPEAYAQASLALKYSAPMKGQQIAYLLPAQEPASPLCAFGDKILYSILGEHPGNENIWHGSQYYHALKTLYEYDSHHNTNNLQLLGVYLFHERKATETSAALHMHRNNVIYRIGRIEKMVELDLNDHTTRVALELSFLMLELFGFPAETEV